MIKLYDVNFINPFLDAVINVLSTMANVKVTPGTPFLNKDRVAIGDVTGLIGVTGYTQGTMSLSLEKDAVLEIVNNMLFESYTEIDDQIADAVGEMTNMISGQARAELSTLGMTFQASTPSVVIGKGHTVNHVSSAPILAIPFTTAKGQLTVEVCFAQPDETQE